MLLDANEWQQRANSITTERVQEKDVYDRYPLHMIGEVSLRFGASSVRLETVEKMIEMFPEALSTRDALGFLPLHYAADGGATPEVLFALWKSYTDAASMRTKGSGLLCLHLAVKSTNSSKLCVETVLSIFPEAAMELDKEGNMPLHLACGTSSTSDGANAAIVELLMTAYPDALAVKNNKGMVPLHMACLSNNVEAVDELLKVFPIACAERDLLGQTPVHFASKAGAQECLVSLLAILSSEEVSSSLDDAGNTPLHMASAGGRACSGCVKLLLDHTHLLVYVTNGEGKTCLHSACSSGRACFDAIMLLLRAYPEAASLTDGDGHLPLHLAALSSTSHDVMKELVRIDKALIRENRTDVQVASSWQEEPIASSTTSAREEEESLAKHEIPTCPPPSRRFTLVRGEKITLDSKWKLNA